MESLWKLKLIIFENNLKNRIDTVVYLSVFLCLSVCMSVSLSTYLPVLLLICLSVADLKLTPFSQATLFSLRL